MTKTGSRSRTVSDRKHNNISFQRKENRLLEPNQQKFVPNKDDAPKRSRTYTLILGFKQKPGCLGPYTPNYFLRNKTGSRRRAVPDRRHKQNYDISFQKKSAPRAEWNKNKAKQKGPTKMKNQNYALGTRGTLNMLNKVVAKLARKPNNPNVGERHVTRGRTGN